MEHVDFTKCRRIFGKAYNGANGKKIAVEYEGAVYMLKFPPSAENKPTDLSCTNSCFSEHIASSIFRMLGICTQETLLGTFQISGKTKVVCACKDFTANGKILYDFCSIKNTILDSDHAGAPAHSRTVYGSNASQRLDSSDSELFMYRTGLAAS